MNFMHTDKYCVIKHDTFDLGNKESQRYALACCNTRVDGLDKALRCALMHHYKFCRTLTFCVVSCQLILKPSQKHHASVEREYTL